MPELDRINSILNSLSDEIISSIWVMFTSIPNDKLLEIIENHLNYRNITAQEANDYFNG